MRQREAARGDIRDYFHQAGYTVVDLSTPPHPCELAGALVIDRARALGYCGLSERCDEAGAALMHHAWPSANTTPTSSRPCWPGGLP